MLSIVIPSSLSVPYAVVFYQMLWTQSNHADLTGFIFRADQTTYKMFWKKQFSLDVKAWCLFL